MQLELNQNQANIENSSSMLTKHRHDVIFLVWLNNDLPDQNFQRRLTVSPAYGKIQQIICKIKYLNEHSQNKVMQGIM